MHVEIETRRKLYYTFHIIRYKYFMYLCYELYAVCDEPSKPIYNAPFELYMHIHFAVGCIVIAKKKQKQHKWTCGKRNRPFAVNTSQNKKVFRLEMFQNIIHWTVRQSQIHLHAFPEHALNGKAICVDFLVNRFSSMGLKKKMALNMIFFWKTLSKFSFQREDSGR